MLALRICLGLVVGCASHKPGSIVGTWVYGGHPFGNTITYRFNIDKTYWSTWRGPRSNASSKGTYRLNRDGVLLKQSEFRLTSGKIDTKPELLQFKLTWLSPDEVTLMRKEFANLPVPNETWRRVPSK